jgi:hypothetical protein
VHVYDGGRTTERWANAVGRITYDAGGRVTSLLMSGRRNEADGSSSPSEVQGEFTAYFGTYQIDAAQGVITHQVAASLSGIRASGELRRSYEVKDGMLILGFPATQNGVPVTNRLIWKRVSF